jgi:hypothetical protein
MARSESALENSSGREMDPKETGKLLSVLLDSRIAKTSAGMCDIAERLVAGEKENAKLALQQLWELKNHMVIEKNGTIDLLIRYYQEKIDVLRTKEEHIRNVSKDSRELLEEKRQRDEELNLVKHQIAACNQEIVGLNAKVEQLSHKEEELVFIDQQLKKELGVNENEILNGLYEIILAQQADEDKRIVADVQAVADERKAEDAASGQPVEPVAPLEVTSAGDGIAAASKETIATAPESVEGQPVSRPLEYEEKPQFPRSIVKTAQGRIIGEYFYDGGVEKADRHYILNSKFFGRVAADCLKKLKSHFEEALFVEFVQMAQDAQKRVSGSTRFHFEVSTNEILNENTLSQFLLDAKTHSFDEMERFCTRLLAKIETLGRNYPVMLKEQIERCHRIQ